VLVVCGEEPLALLQDEQRSASAASDSGLHRICTSIQARTIGRPSTWTMPSRAHPSFCSALRRARKLSSTPAITARPIGSFTGNSMAMARLDPGVLS
jgi:hypothetical protein